VREAIERGTAAREITGGFQTGLADFEKLREPFLLYH
jgi:hypothetical protein